MKEAQAEAVKDAVKLAEEKAKDEQDVKQHQTVSREKNRETQRDEKDDDDDDNENVIIDKDEDGATSDEESSSSSSSGWTQLMGQDLVMKTIRSPDRNNRDDDEDDDGDALAVQPEDVVRIDFVGRLALTKDQALQQQQQQNQSSSSSSLQPIIFQEARDVVISIGAKDVVPAIEMCVRFMKIGETALVWSHSKYAHGPGTRRRRRENDDDSKSAAAAVVSLPPNSNVCYEITVQHVYSNKERSEASFPVFIAQSRKSIANDIYAHEWQEPPAAVGVGGGQGKQRAIYLYQRTAKEMLQVVNEEEANSNNAEKSDHNNRLLLRDQALAILLDCLNNIVAVHLRAKEYHAAKLGAVKVLELDPHNIKALIRAAKASLLDPASSYTEVQAALEAATERLSIVQKNIDTRSNINNSKDDDGSNNNNDDDDDTESLKRYQADLRRLYVDFSKRQQEYKQRSKNMFSRALGAKDKKNKTSSSKDDGASNKANKAPPTTTPPPNDAAAAADTNVDDDDSPPWYKNLPWKDKILPLMFQTIVPFFLWYFVHHFQGFPSSSSLPVDTTAASTPDDATRKPDSNDEL